MLEIVAVIVSMNVWTLIKLAEGTMAWGRRIEQLLRFLTGEAMPCPAVRATI
jgi:hypothetical protein